MELPEFLMHNGERKRVVKWQASWSLSLQSVPHVLWIMWEGAGNKYDRFYSDEAGGFPELDVVPEPEGIASGWFSRSRHA